ncbi:MAG: hypothetical protein KDN20_10665 [Verrucomicrobiae bacterium]|nr:hypothetical protein [Verrucomicrobiae bacterium]
MHKTAKIDFFTVEIADSIDLETILRMVHQKPSDSQKRNVEINDDWIRLARGNLTDDGYLGDMMRISMAPAGFRANLAGDITAVSLSKDEGMAECSAFYYDFETSILALQRNSKAVSSRMLSSYFKQIGDVEGEVEIKPVLHPTDIMKVKVLPVIRKIHIVSTFIDVMPTLDNVDENTKRLIQFAAQSESGGIEIVMKSPREKGATLNQAVALETLESWLRIHNDFSDEENEIVKKIVVSGKDETGTTVEFDMLKDRMYSVMSYQWVPDDRELWKTRSGHIQTAWDLYKANLKRMLAETETSE